MTIDDLSPRPTSAMGEAELTHGYGLARILPVFERCAWDQELIKANSRGEVDVTRAVRAHNDSTAHQQAIAPLLDAEPWRCLLSAQQEPPTARAPRTALEVAAGGPGATVTRSRASAAPAGKPARAVR